MKIRFTAEKRSKLLSIIKVYTKHFDTKKQIMSEITNYNVYVKSPEYALAKEQWLENDDEREKRDVLISKSEPVGPKIDLDRMMMPNSKPKIKKNKCNSSGFVHEAATNN
jgi:hypothetical protein